MIDDCTILRLEAYDDAVTIRDRLAFVDAPRALLVLPGGTRLLTRKLDLLLVQRHAARLGIQLALVTTDLDVIDCARDLNLSVFPSEAVALQHPWQRPRDTDFAAPHDPQRQSVIVERIIRERMNALNPGALRRWRWTRWAAFGGLVAAVVLTLLIVGPSATVTLTPASRQVYETVSIVADPDLTDIDIENRRMPASVVSLESTARVTVQSSGKESAGATQAQGLVTLSNASDQPILVPAGTVVSTSDIYPIRFETLIETTLPVGNTPIQVPIQALLENSGATGNVDPGTINRVEATFADLVTITNPNATYGGALRERGIVTADDHERLIVLGRQQVLQRARDVLLHQLSGDQFLVPGSVMILEERPEWTVYSAFVGDPAESVSLDLRARVQAVVVDEQQAHQVAYAALAPYIQPGMEISLDALSFQRGDIVSIEGNGRVTFLMTVTGNVAVSIDEDYVRSRVRGLGVDSAGVV